MLPVSPIMDVIYIILVLYGLESILSIITSLSLGKHLYNTFKRGHMSVHMFILFLFLLGYGLHLVGITVWILLYVESIEYLVNQFNKLVILLLFLSRSFSLLSIVALAYLIIFKRFDIFITRLSEKQLKGE